MLTIALNASIMLLSIIGITLYIYGYIKRESTNTEAKLILLLSFFLLFWAVLTCLVASGLYNDDIQWSMNPGIRALTIWDYMEYLTWELKAITWIGTGLLLAVTSFMKLLARQYFRNSHVEA
jgi:uncharacterized membrane protein